MNPHNKTFISINGPISGRDAMKRYPDPAFFMRGSVSLSHDELRGLIHRNADEVIRVVELIRSCAGPCVGRTTKGMLLNNANLLHDMRMLVDIHGGEMGRPYLWEV